jgi:hypothetical protein
MRLWRWLILVLGVWQLSSTYALHVTNPLVVEASVVFGFLIVLAGIMANLVPDRWPTYASGLLGLGLVAMPFVHDSPATTEFLVVGVLTCLASLAEFLNRQHT